MLKVLLHQLHPQMSHDCPLAILHKKREYTMEIVGDCFWPFRLYLGVFLDMYLGYFSFDVFIVGCIC